MRAEVDKWDINKLVWIIGLNNLKTKVNNLDIDKLKDIPVDLKKVSDVVSKELVKNLKLKKINTRVNNLEKKIPNGML